MKREYLSVSALKAFMKSPNHYLEYVKGREPSPAMQLGTAIHAHVLEPETYKERYTFLPSIDRRTKDGKATYAAWLEEHTSKTILSVDQWETVDKCGKVIDANSDARALLQGCEFEKRVEAELWGVPFVGIADAISDGYIVDLKTCRDASPDQFTRDAYNLGYHLQAAAYRLLTGRERFYWICVETSEPYNVAVYQQSQGAYEATVPILKEWVERWKAWDGKEAGYFSGVKELYYPRWVK